MGGGRITVTRRIEWDAGHRVVRHESKCRNVHGHRYRADVTVSAPALDEVGRVVDFGVLKSAVGSWVDATWDHGYLHHPDDEVGWAIEARGMKTFVMPLDAMEPTAENIALVLARSAQSILDIESDGGLRVERVRIWETPNCWADWSRGV
jgi:6-pyruvoyltetrahydropterin/6-carboxytetrahydropterin synthase